MIQTKYVEIPTYQDSSGKVGVDRETNSSWKGRVVHVLTAPIKFIGKIFSQSIHGLVWMGKSLCCCVGGERKAKKIVNQKSHQDKTLQEKVNDRGLNINIKFPIPEKANIDPEKKELFLANINSEEHRSVARKAIENIQYITVEDLQEKLKLCIDQLNRKVRNWDQATLFAVPQKSQYWLSQMALGDMAGLPKQLKSTSIDGDFFNITKPGVSIMFDDCSYSGTQLIRIAKNMYEAYATQKSNAEHTVYFVIPYATKYARYIMDLINKDPAKLCGDLVNPGSKLKFEFITVADLQLVSESGFTPQELQLFNELNGGSSKNLEWTERKALAYMQWKMPDEWSAPTTFFEGRLPHDLRVNSNQVRYIPEIKPPYKSE